jgi:hypothetical protein
MGARNGLLKDLGWRTTKVADAAVVYALAGDEPTPDQSQNEPHDETQPPLATETLLDAHRSGSWSRSSPN